MIENILGRRLDMTRHFREDGRMESVTAVEAGPCTITQIKLPSKDGYSAVQIGFDEVKALNKPEKGHSERAGAMFKHLREVRVESSSDLQVGQKLDISVFKPGQKVDVSGISKGRGFAGVVKRWHFAGGPKTHGQSDRHRAPGSIGGTTYPGRVVKGLKMAGHMGNRKVTVKNLEVIESDASRNLLLLRGAVPGPRNGILMIRTSRASG